MSNLPTLINSWPVSRQAPASLYVIKLQLRGLNHIDLNVCVCVGGRYSRDSACILSVSYRYSLYRRSTDLIMMWQSLFLFSRCDLFIRQSLHRVIIWAISSCTSLICHQTTNCVNLVMSWNLLKQLCLLFLFSRKTICCTRSSAFSSSNIVRWPVLLRLWLLMFCSCVSVWEADKAADVCQESEQHLNHLSSLL